MQEEIVNEKTSSGILTAPFFIALNIIVYAVKGLKALFYDIWVILFHSLGHKVDKSINKTVSYDEEMKDVDTTYSKIKKKTKTYHYSEKKLAKLEEKKKALLEDLQSAGATRSKVSHIYKFTVKEPDGKISTFIEELFEEVLKGLLLYHKDLAENMGHTFLF